MRHGEDLVEIETDKATLSYQADADGVLEIVAAEGDTLPIGAVIARLGGSGSGGSLGGDRRGVRGPSLRLRLRDGSVRWTPRGPPPGRSGFPARASFRSPPSSSPSPASGERVRASPLARRLAKERGIELAGLQGTGPGGRVVREDVEHAAASPSGAPPAPPATPPPPPRRPPRWGRPRAR